MKLSKITILVAASLSIITLVGCSSDGDSPTPTPTPTPAPTPTPPAAITFPVQTESPSAAVIGDSGSLLTAESGLSLYSFANDTDGTSVCNGVDGDEAGSTTDDSSCAGTWPPLIAGDGATASGYFSLITRDDSTMQWAYNNSPLYTFSGDSTQGDINGEGIGGVWDLARPKPIATEQINELATYVGNQTVKSVTSTSEVLEQFRVDKEGFSLYFFDADPVGEAACYGLNGDGCITTWPPLLADNAAKASAPLSILELANGQSQWAYKGKAMYFFSGDTEAGQTNGDGLGNSWHIASQLPALQRGSDDNTMLSATGYAYALLPNPDNNNAVEVQKVDRDQFTLYTFDNDTAGASNCSGSCIESWPAFIAPDSEAAIGKYSKVDRGDGVMQWAYNDMPLYFFGGDTEKGQANGDGLGGVWHIVQPAPQIDPVTTALKVNDGDLGETFSTTGMSISLVSDGNGGFAPTTLDKTDFQLYTFAPDGEEQATCISDGCQQSWPALLASANDQATAPFSIFERDDGHMQWAVNGQPLYFFTGDTSAGQANGEGVGGSWWVARPAPLRVFTHDTKGYMLIANGKVLASQGKTAEQLTDLTVYTFDDDVADSGLSTCFGGCAVTWPPLYATSNDQAFGEYEIISRTESDNSTTLQWTYKGLPLYFFISDSEIGDTGGDYPTWEIARP